MNAAELAEQIGAKRSGNGWTARCPAHDDRNPSLSISDGDNGCTLIHCHAGCASDEVLAALHLSMVDLAPPKMNGHDETAYRYTDEAGRLLFEVVRKPGKKFLQRRPDGLGGWIYKRSERLVLYNLQRVLKAVANDVTVFICEGEKDADRVIAEGYCATTNPMGAGKWSKVAAHAQEVLAGADVMVVRDMDDPGLLHAKEIVSSLRGVAKSVLLVEPTTGKDVSDHLAAGLTIDDLIEMEPTNEVELSTTDDDLPEAVDWHKLWARDATNEWLVDDLWPAGRQLHIFAARKTGKSLIALWIALHLATGRDPFTGDKREPVIVDYLDHEMTEDDLLERAEGFGFKPDELDNLRYYLLPSMPPLDTAEGGHRLMRLVERDHANAVVIDTLSRVVKGKENENDTFQDFYMYTGRRLKLAGVAMARLDHEGHEAGRSRGASAKADDVDVVWRLEATDQGLAFVRKATRLSWVPERVEVERVDDRFRIGSPSWPVGTKAKAELLDQLDAPLILSKRKAMELLRDNGVEVGRHDVLLKAIRYRQQLGYHFGNHPELTLGTSDGNH